MHVLLGGLVAMAMAPSSHPRAIDPAANRPEIVAPAGGAADVPPPKVEPRPTGGTAPDRDGTTRDGTTTRSTLEPELGPHGCFPERGPCRRLNVGGIVATSLGLTMVGSGIGLMLAPQFPVPEEPVTNYSLRPPGVALVVVGAVSTLAGVLLIVTGHLVRKKKKPTSEDWDARVRLGPGGLRW